jgi:type III restriction enzyme
VLNGLHRIQILAEGVATRAKMTESFFERPILNSPYEVPRRHHALDRDGQPLDEPPVEGRRRSELITPVPKPRKRKSKPEQEGFVFGDSEGLSSVEQEYNPTPIINEIRSHVASWRICRIRPIGASRLQQRVS